MTDEQRTIGRLEAQVSDLRENMKEVNEKLDRITALVEQGKGAKWVIGLAAGLLSFASTAVAFTAGWFKQ